MNKRLAVALAVVSISASATVAMAGKNAGTGINGSPHDLNADARFDVAYTHDKFERTCVFCHTPHNARNGNTAGAAENAKTPLWNHADYTVPQVALVPYHWVAPANAGDAFTITDPLVGPSRLCMACHDGSTAVDSHGSAGYTTGDTHPMTAYYNDNLGTKVKRFIDDLTVTHPIGFDYNAVAAARGEKEIVPSTYRFISGDVGSSGNWNTTLSKRSVEMEGKKISDTLYNGFMTCASCHDVHNTLNVADNANSYNYFLYAKEKGSAICLSCHVK